MRGFVSAGNRQASAWPERQALIRPPTAPPRLSPGNKKNIKNSERELASVKISKDDVEVLAEQVEVDAKVAERRLRECGGDLARALRSYLPSAPPAAAA